MTQQKMTETNKSNEKIEMLMQLLASKPELIDVLLDNILAEGKKKRKNRSGEVENLFFFRMKQNNISLSHSRK